MKKIILLSLVILVGCGESNIEDLESFVRDTSDKPRGRIKALPEFQPYSSFAYSASGLRSPFESPMSFDEVSDIGLDTVEAPDENRKKMVLESFSLGELTLVGTLSKNTATLKALVKTSSGSVHVLEEGQFIGKNNGRVIRVAESKIDIVEVVPNGNGGWISRPQSMGMNVSSGAK
jgi:type IV pilus assembly protein PilP